MKKFILFLFIIFTILCQAQNTKISALPSGAPALTTDDIVIARAGANYKLTLQDVLNIAPTIATTTNLLAGDNAGNAQDSGIASNTVVVTSGDQTIAGVKTFTDGIKVGAAVPSDSSTVAGGPVKLSGGNYVAAVAADAANTPVWVVGTATGDYGGTTIRLVTGGQVTVPFDATTVVAGDCVVKSTTIDKKWHDAGSTCPVGSQIIGRVVSGGAGSASYPIQISNSFIRGTTSASEVVAQFNSGTCSGYLKSDGTCDAGSGGNTVLPSPTSTTALVTYCWSRYGASSVGSMGIGTCADSGTEATQDAPSATTLGSKKNATAASSNSVAGPNDTMSGGVGVASFGHTNFYYAKVYAVNYTGTAIYWVGLAGTATGAGLGVADPNTTKIAAFRGVVGTDTNWQCYMANGGSVSTVTDSGVAISTTTLQALSVSEGASSFTFQINGVTVCGAMSQSNRPTSGTAVGIAWVDTAAGTSAQNIAWQETLHTVTRY